MKKLMLFSIMLVPAIAFALDTGRGRFITSATKANAAEVAEAVETAKNFNQAVNEFQRLQAKTRIQKLNPIIFELKAIVRTPENTVALNKIWTNIQSLEELDLAKLEDVEYRNNIKKAVKSVLEHAAEAHPAKAAEIKAVADKIEVGEYPPLPGARERLPGAAATAKYKIGGAGSSTLRRRAGTGQ